MVEYAATQLKNISLSDGVKDSVTASPNREDGAGAISDGGTAVVQASSSVPRIRRVTFRRRRRRPRVFDWPKRNLFEATCLTDEVRGSMVKDEK